MQSRKFKCIHKRASEGKNHPAAATTLSYLSRFIIVALAWNDEDEDEEEDQEIPF